MNSNRIRGSSIMQQPFFFFVCQCYYMNYRLAVYFPTDNEISSEDKSPPLLHIWPSSGENAVMVQKRCNRTRGIEWG